jgi:hypothetical protein
MSTIYSWTAEMGADTTGAAGDWVMVYDTSAGRTKKARLSSLVNRSDPAAVIGWYGEAGVNQGTMTASALTALATATISAANSATVFGFASSTVAIAYAKRMSQIQADLETLMGKIDSTGLIDIAGV